MPKDRKILIVEDNQGVRKQLKWALNEYDLVFAENRQEAIVQVKSHSPSVVTLDLGLPPDEANASEGLKTLEEILNIKPYCKIIVVTGNDDKVNALNAIALGAYDFYEKPVDPDVLCLIVARAAKVFELEAENRRLQEKNLNPGPGVAGIVGTSSQIMAACRMIEKVGPSEATTLLLGESGTGKELFAKALHDFSPRKNKPFIAVNCAAIPENLLESELFGYEKGAFTGATKQTIGKLEYANGGTLFLDEIGDMPMPLQAKMLRFLQERTIDRLGGREPIPVDIRVICATHKNIEKAINNQLFRQDLYFRISNIVINIPPLRDRQGDKTLLATFFLNKFSEKNQRSFLGFTPDALSHIENYAWPGNVRELENVIGRAVILTEGQRITTADLGFNDIDDEASCMTLKHARESAERQIIQKALILHNNNVTQAAQTLEVSRPQLYNLIKKLGVSYAGE